MRRLSTTVLAIVTAIVIGLPSLAAEKPPWTRVHEVDGIVVYQRASSDPSLHQYRAIGVVDVPAAALRAVLKDRERYTEFFPYLQEKRLFERDGQLYSYERIKAPLVSERDYTVKLVDEDLPNGGLLVRFSDANDFGPPRSKSRVRVESVQGKWHIEHVTRGKSRITYHVHTDPGGSIPRFAINMANKRGVSRAVLALVDRARWLLENDELPDRRPGLVPAEE